MRKSLTQRIKSGIHNVLQRKILTTTQLEYYNENGYLVLPKFFSYEKMESLRSQIYKLMSHHCESTGMNQNQSFSTTNNRRTVDFMKTGDIIYFFTEEGIYERDSKGNERLKVPIEQAFNKAGHNLHDIDPVFESFCYSPEFKEIVKDLGFSIPKLVQTMYIFKNQKVGGAVNVHTDNTFLITNPLSCVGFWVGIDSATKENGCLWGIPGSHKEKTVSFMVRDEKGENTVFEERGDPSSKSLDITNAVPIEADVGTLVLWHGDWVHFSHENTSSNSRHALTMHVIESQNVEWDQKNWMQRPFRKFFDVKV